MTNERTAPADQPPAAEAVEPEPTPPPGNVIEAIARVMADLPGIGKDDHSEQGYNYRGIESITRHAQQLFGRYGVVFVPEVRDRKVIDLVINGRPWTEEQLTVVYRVYGPGGASDCIEVGPLVGLGRDNSDKGANKAMTQAFKYALLQVLCVGDGKDDADKSEAHVADARQVTIDPDRQVRIDLGERIRQLSASERDVVRSFCDDNKIPRVSAQMTDEQVEAVTEKLDAMAIAAEQDAAAEVGDAVDGQDALPGVGGADTAPDAPEGHTGDVGHESGEPVVAEHDVVRSAQDIVAGLSPSEVIGRLESLGLDPKGRPAEHRRQLVDALTRQDADG